MAPKINSLELYKLAIETRNLEIKLFWQRALFFAAFISAIFIGYTRGNVDNYTKLILIVFGIFFSLAWSLANRGSKYWYESWEQKIKEIENEIGINLFSKWVFPQHNSLLYSGRLYSVSKITIYLSDLVIIGWLLLFIKDAYSIYNNFISNYVVAFTLKRLLFNVIFLFIIQMLLLLLIGTRTNIPKAVKKELSRRKNLKDKR